MTHPPVHLRMVGITKRFPGVVALAGVSLDLHGGEVLSLMGENGAGKSTLMKILGGAYPPDEGTIEIDGQPVTFRGVSDSKARGIALIHQELMLAPNVDIAGNIFMGNEKRLGGRYGPMDRRAMRRQAAAVLRRVGLNVSPATPVSLLTAGQMQMVEIAKALSADARVLIMDEPTSSLTAGESEQLFTIIAQLKAEGLAIVVHLAPDGGGRPPERPDHDPAGRAVHRRPVPGRGDPGQDRQHDGRPGVHHPLPRPARAEPGADQPPVLSVENVGVPGASAGVTFTARRGEILGFAGLVGAGRTELMQVLFGVDRATAGTMTLDGQSYRPRSPRDAIDAGVYLAPEDRKRHGLVLPMSVAQNTSLPDIGNYTPAGWLNRTTEKRVAEAEVKRMRIKTPDVGRRVVNLSGGNQQKVVLGKWLAMKPRVLILDEPTRGIDVGAKAEIYRTMVELAEAGMTILMVSSDMEEVIGMSDRVAVMHERRLRAVLPRSQATQAAIGSLMTGQAFGGAAPSAGAIAGAATVVTTAALTAATHGPHGAAHPSNPTSYEGSETPQ